MSKQDMHQQGRVPPQAIEMEEGVLGAMMIEQEARKIALDRLDSSDFYKTSHRHIFEAMQALDKRADQMDLLSVEQELIDQELLDVCGGSGYLSELTRSVSSAANIDYHCQVLLEKSTLRNIILTGTDTIKEAYNSAADPYEVLARWKERFEEVEKRSSVGEFPSTGESTAEVLEESVYETMVTDGFYGVPAYLPVDRLTSGFPPSELTIVAARPSMGKTGLMLTIVKNLLEQGFQLPIVIFSYEMTAKTLILRLMCMIAQVKMNFVRQGKLEVGEKARLVEAARLLGVEAQFHTQSGKLKIPSVKESKLFIFDDNKIDADRFVSVCRRMEMDYGELGIVMSDYLQLMSVGDARRKNLGTREQEIGYISRRHVEVAKEMECPVIALSQLSRKVEDRPGDNRPNLGDLRESGTLEQDASIVIFLYRPEYYGKKRTDEGISTDGMAELIVRKNRNGPVGTELARFTKKFAIFEEWDHEAAAMRSSSGDPREDQWVHGRDDPGEKPPGIDDELPF